MNVIEEFNETEQERLRQAWRKQNRRTPLDPIEALLVRTYAQRSMSALRKGLSKSDRRRNEQYRAWLVAQGQDPDAGFSPRLWRKWRAAVRRGEA